MGTDASAEATVLSLPKGGGSIAGLGEKFTADEFTGTAGFSVPIAVPPGRSGMTPQLALNYSSGSGNGPFGLGWQLNLPGVSRRTSRGVPRYTDADVFVLSGAEDLVPVGGGYRPRVEGLFARIKHVRDESGDYWEATDRGGVRTRYGELVVDPADPRRVFGWRVTQTHDPVGNVIRFGYVRDRGQPLIGRVSYADYGPRDDPSFLVDIDFEYEQRPDPISDRRPGFEVRTTLRCKTIRVTTRAADGVARVVREMRFGYVQAPFNGVSLLSRVDVVGVDGQAQEAMPPLLFDYTSFDPSRRRFEPVTGSGLPTEVLSDPRLALVDLRGMGLPDIVELGPSPRVWRNTGNRSFDRARVLSPTPPFGLDDPNVRLLDADGDGRADLLVTALVSGYFPTTFAGGWDPRSLRPYRLAPSVPLADPSVRLIDLDGDGLTDLVRSGTRLQTWFNHPDPDHAWERSVRDQLSVDFADPRIRLADMTGDGLQDIVLLRNGNVAYWPNLGHGRWGEQVTMRRAPRLPDGFDPRRVLLGDVDGDGAADLLYLDRGRVMLWGNQSGDAWTQQPVIVAGTPDISDSTHAQLSDLNGTGMAGVLFSRPADGSGQHLRLLDLTGGVKPHLLATIDNGMGAITRVTYGTSTQEYLRDNANPATRWRTTLPFPVHVVSRVEVVDAISGGRLNSSYRYRHGYWDGMEREFRGFAMVEKLDTDLTTAAEPPILNRSWFHPGPVAATTADDWTELDLSNEYSPLDRPMLARPDRPPHRDALRALRGQLLRTELYALDGTDRAHRPYSVSETVVGVRQEPDAPIYFPFLVANRTTQWERGDEPMHRFTFPAGFDAYGQPVGQIDIAVPRGRDPLSTVDTASEPYLATYSSTDFARRDDPEHYLVDRVSRTRQYEVVNDGRLSVTQLRDAVLTNAPTVSMRLISDVRTHFDGEAFIGLALGELGEHGLAVRTESLAFTDGFLRELFGESPPVYLTGAPWPPHYPQEFRDLLAPTAGYVRRDGGYYVSTSRCRYDTQTPGLVPRGLQLASLNPHGAQSRIEYDEHDLLPVRTIDSLGLTNTAVNDYRLLAPRSVTDVNGNTSAVTHSPAGIVVAQSITGRAGEGDRDGAPSVRIEPDLMAFFERRQPVSVRTSKRVTHDASAEVIVSIAYHDGFGRVLQTRTQAEDTLYGDPVFGGAVIPADQLTPVPPSVGRTRAPGEPDNVIVSGAQVYDGKGRVIRKFEPFFGTGFDFRPPGESENGQSVRLFYDPRGQVVRTLSPDGGEERVVHGIPGDLSNPDAFTPTPWESYTYDANDNAGRTHADSAGPYRSHWNTPASAEVDALGRTVRMVVRNGADPATDWHTTSSTYDIQGRAVSVTDPLGRQALHHVRDLAGRLWRLDSLDAGRHDRIVDAAGNAVELRDGRGAVQLFAHDRSHRPVRIWARDDGAIPITLRRTLEYGDGGDPDQPAGERAAARERNLLGRIARERDEAGMVTTELVDFKGNPLQSVRQVIADSAILATYAAGRANGWRIPAFRVDWTPPPGRTQQQHDAAVLEPEGYRSNTTFDALNRVTAHILPADIQGLRRRLVPNYNRAGALERVLLDDTVQVERIAYDAKGQRTLIGYGNGAVSRCAYDPRTFRLARQYTERDGEVLQDYGYDYDLAGNLLTLRDRTPGSGIPGNPDALTAADPLLRTLLGRGDAIDRSFTYDPLYRLLAASGREHEPETGGEPWKDVPAGADLTRVRSYRQTYTYDAVGALLRLVHSAGAAGFNRHYAPVEGSNRLRRMTVGTVGYDYTYDANGNLLSEAGARHHAWNHAGCLATFGTQTPGAEPSIHAHYLYDADGQRVKKLVRRQGGAIEVTHYLDQAFEHHRWAGGANNLVHVTDDKFRVATVRFGPAHPRDRGPAVSVQLTDHLSSSVALLDGSGALVNREEYAPYGETLFGSFARKRYRFTGKERDEESGLNYHGARYYAPWLARWCAVDPLILNDGAFDPGSGRPLDPYGYCHSSPIGAVDPDGRDVYILLATNDRAKAGHSPIDEAAIMTRRGEIEGSKSFDPKRDKIYVLKVYDLGKLAEEVAKVRADAAKNGRGPTVEFGVWGHASNDGPIGDRPTSGPYQLGPGDDANQMKLEGWNQIDFGWKWGKSSAAFYGCRATFTGKFLEGQVKKGLGKAGYFDVASYPSQSPTEYVKERENPDLHVDDAARMIDKGLLPVPPFGIWYLGIEQSDHQLNTFFGSDVDLHPMVWLAGNVPPAPKPKPTLGPPAPPRQYGPHLHEMGAAPGAARPAAARAPAPARAPSHGSSNCQFGPGSPDPRGHTRPGFIR